MTIEQDLISLAISSILNELSGKIEISRALKLKDFKGSESTVEQIEDHLYRIYVKASDETDCRDIFEFDVEIESPIEDSVLYKKMHVTVDIEEKLSYSKKKLKVAETIHRMLKKSILFPEYNEEI